MNPRIALLAKSLGAIAALAGLAWQGRSLSAQVGQPPEGPGSPAELLRSWVSSHTPDENHRRLDVLVGDWDLSGWWRPAGAPDDAEVPLAGTVTASWVLDGRFLQVRVMGRSLGVSYSALQYIGYDRLKRRYQFIAMESTTTTANVCAGTYDAAADSIAFRGEIADPAAIGSYKGVLSLGGERPLFEGFHLAPDGREVKVSKHTYVRRASSGR